MEITILYTAIIILVGLSIDNDSKLQRRNYIIFVTIILTLVAGLRSIWIGTDDTSLYYNHFINNSFKTLKEIWENEWKDPVYYIIQKILATIVGDSYQNILLLYASIYSTTVGYLIYKESKDPLVSYIILLSMGFFFFSMNGLRQSISISILMLAYFPLRNRQFLWFLVLVIIATAFHKTAAIFIIAYPASKGNINIFTLTLYLLIFILGLTYGDEILKTITEQVSPYDDRFEIYQEISNGLTYSGLVQLLLFGIFSMSRYRQVIEHDNKSKVLYVLLIWAIIFQTLATNIAEMFRIAMYFSIFLIILIPKVLDTIPQNYKRLLTFTLSVALLTYFFFLGAGKVPYHFCFESGWGIESI